MTFLLGAVITVGALYIGGFGGAFEANKLFTGLFAIPMTIPLVLGIALKRPQPWGALATLGLGVVLGLALNTIPSLSWELATLIEIMACTGVFLLSGYIGSSTSAYQQRIKAFFRKLATPLTEAEKPKENWEFQRSMNRLYAFALALTGILFMTMSVPSFQDTSGRFSFGAGIGCAVLALVLWFYNRDNYQKTIGKSEKKEYESVER